MISKADKGNSIIITYQDEYHRKVMRFTSNNNFTFFYVSLTVHLSITLDNDQLDAHIFNTFITILYMHMFRAITCPSSGGQIVLIQHLVSSLTESDDTRCCTNTISPPEDDQDIARNMYMFRIVTNVLKKLCIKLVIV